MASNGKSGGRKDPNDSKVAVDLQQMIHEGRDRKKNEALAARIFGKDHRSSAPSSPKLAPGAGSLASRAGVKKQRAVPPTRPRHSTGNIDGEWTHDLHDAPRGPRASGSGAGSLAARITDPKAPPTGPASYQRQKRRAAQVAEALIRSELHPPRSAAARQAQQGQKPSFANGAAAAATTTTTPFNRGMSIRGLAGPYVVMAQNFAPGTTAADIESAMTPIGGIVTSCWLVKQHPIVLAEIVFESKEGADNAIATFNNQTADGRVLHVYYKVGNTPSVQTPTRPSSDNDMVVDGSYGFEEPVETTTTTTTTTTDFTGKQPPTGPAASRGGLYSDKLVNTNRWGRGFSRSGGRFGSGR